MIEILRKTKANLEHTFINKNQGYILLAILVVLILK